MKYVKRDIINFLVKKYDLNALDICDEPEMLVLNILGYILKQDVLKLKAENYLDFMAFSRDGLHDQLEFEGFSEEQIQYGLQADGY